MISPTVEWQRHSPHVRLIVDYTGVLEATQKQCDAFRSFANSHRALPGYMASPTLWMAWFHRRDVSEAVTEIERIQKEVGW